MKRAIVPSNESMNFKQSLLWEEDYDSGRENENENSPLPGLLGKQSWVVVGSHGKNPVVFRLVNKLLTGKKTVHRVNPSLASSEDSAYNSLKVINEHVDVVVLIISPQKGLRIVEDMCLLGIRNLWIQPGAASPEILSAARQYGINVHEGCIMLEAPW